MSLLFKKGEIGTLELKNRIVMPPMCMYKSDDSGELKAFHKTFQFCGLEPLETYAVHDIFKGDLDLNAELEKFEKVLTKNFL